MSELPVSSLPLQGRLNTIVNFVEDGQIKVKGY
jgi:hypothetical protein